MKRYRIFPYEIKQTSDGKYYGIVYPLVGKGISEKTEEYIVAHDAYVEITEIVDKIRDASDQPPNRKENG